MSLPNGSDTPSTRTVAIPVEHVEIAALCIKAYLKLGEQMSWAGMEPGEVVILRGKLNHTGELLRQKLLEL